MKQYDVIVVGAGNAGISAALALAQQGVKPLVLERHNMPGGCASSFVRGRFEYDVSLHALYYKAQGFQSVWEGQMDIHPDLAEIPARLTFSYLEEDGSANSKVYPLGVQNFLAEFEKNNPGCGAKMGEYLSTCGQVLQGAAFMQSPEYTPELLAERFPAFVKYGRMTAQQAIDAMELPPAVRRYLGAFWWYVGSSVENYSFPLFAGITFGVIQMPMYYPHYTCHGYLAIMEKKIRELGGEIWFNTGVTEILVEDNKVKGVKTDKGDTLLCDRVITNAGPRVVFEQLIKSGVPRQAEFLEEQKNIRENYSFVCVFLGLDASAEELGITCHHLFFTDADDPAVTYEASGTLHGPFAMGGLCPNVTFPDFSPEGTCVLSLSVGIQGFALEGLSQEEYFKEKQRIAHEIIESASRHLGVNLFDYIEEIEVSTPATLARYANLRNGSLSFAQNPVDTAKATAARAVLNSPEGVEGLTFVGQHAFNIGYRNTMFGYGVGAQMAQTMKEGK